MHLFLRLLRCRRRCVVRCWQTSLHGQHTGTADSLRLYNNRLVLVRLLMMLLGSALLRCEHNLLLQGGCVRHAGANQGRCSLLGSVLLLLRLLLMLKTVKERLLLGCEHRLLYRADARRSPAAASCLLLRRLHLLIQLL